MRNYSRLEAWRSCLVLIISLNKLWILPPALGPLSLVALVGTEGVEVVGDLVGTAVQVQGAGDEAESWNSLEVSCRLLCVHGSTLAVLLLRLGAAAPQVDLARAHPCPGTGRGAWRSWPWS